MNEIETKVKDQIRQGIADGFIHFDSSLHRIDDPDEIYIRLASGEALLTIKESTLKELPLMVPKIIRC